MNILRSLAALGLGAAVISYLSKREEQPAGAVAWSGRSRDAADPSDPSPVRPAGAGSMRDRPRTWDARDEASDESFPASDPPSTY